MQGISLLEILLVIGILAILITLIVPVGIDFYKTQQLDSHTQGVLQTLRRAQLKAMAVEADSAFGVYFDNINKRYILFKGTTLDPADPFNEEFDLPTIITITSPFPEVFFFKFEGKPNKTGNITLNSDDESRTISINNFGTISLVPAAPPPVPYLAQVHYRWRADDGGE